MRAFSHIGRFRVVFKKTHWVWGFEKVMKIIGGGGLDEKNHCGGVYMKQKSLGGGGGGGLKL